MADEIIRTVFDAVDRGKGVRDGVDRHTQQVAERSANLTERIRLGWLAIAGGVTMALAAITKGAERLQQIEPIRQAFDNLTRTIGSSADAMLNKLRPATRGLLTDFDLMKQSNNAVILGVARTDDQFAKLTENAIRLGRAVGLDARTAIESLVTGIGRQSRMMLDNLGIIVKAEDAYERYAKSLGKTTDKLTEQERKIAFAQAAMQGIEEAVSKLGAEQETAGDKMAKAWVKVQNLIDNFVTSPAFGNLLKGLMDLAEDVLTFVEDMEPAINAAISGITRAAEAAGLVFSAIKKAWDALPKLLQDALSGGAPGALLGGLGGGGQEGIAVGLIPKIAAKLGGGTLGQVQQLQDMAWDIARATDVTVQKTDEWKGKVSFVESKARGITAFQKLQNQLLTESITYMSRIGEELRWQAQHVEDIAKNWGQLIVGNMGFAGTGDSGFSPYVEEDWFDPSKGPGQFGAAWVESLDSVASMFERTFGGAGSVLGRSLSAFLAIVKSESGNMTKVWAKHWQDVLALGLSTLGQLFGTGKGQSAFTGAAMGVQLGATIGGPWGALIGGIGGFFAGLLGGGGKAKIDPKALALNWEDIFKGQIDALTAYIEKGVTLTDKMLRDIEQSLTYHGSRWTDYIEDLSAAYDTQAEAIYNARNQLEGYHLQLMQGAAALFQYHKSLWELRRSIRETGLALRDLALGEGLRYTQPPGRGADIFGQAESRTWLGMEAYGRLMGDIKDLPTNRFGQIRWGDAREMMGRVNPEAQELVLQLIEQMNQKGLLLTQIDNQQSQMKIARHQRDLLRNNLPIMRNRLERISEILTYMRNHWREEAPGGGGGGDKPGDWPGEPPRKATTVSNQYYQTVNEGPPAVVVQIDSREVSRIVLNNLGRNPEALRQLARAQQQQPGTQGARMRG